ncbi:MAG: helix-turn-helix transcriptional regulator [Phycisphaerae bacterium]|nr:helix-turn-helix transcriptional regulator [Phycisphaerae bacterium]NUQ07964.1 helix-turn-helix transcriptional regulator [Phycisphaerae bacterium]
MRDIIEYMNIADSLKAAAKRSGLSMNAISKRTGLNYQTVHGFLTGERDIAVSTAQRLADLLDLELRPKASKAAGKPTKGGR